MKKKVCISCDPRQSTFCVSLDKCEVCHKEDAIIPQKLGIDTKYDNEDHESFIYDNNIKVIFATVFIILSALSILCLFV